MGLPRLREVFRIRGGALDDLGVELRPRETTGDDLEVAVVDLHGRVVGRIHVYYERANGLARVETARLRDDLHGRGIGTAAYLALDDYVRRRRGLRLASDVTRSPAAEALWRRLVAMGRARHEPHHAFSGGQYVMVDA